MGLFNRSKPASEPRLPAPEEIGAAGRALARGNAAPADRLCAEAGPHSQTVALNILGVSVDYTPQD
ncbi:hypothetical protein [Streptomyces sp. NPDC007346]|uniref:hypothetical protein n=1 Tax=Streptomyces sp. NPDC007346 TaxID=3154682 RepID=UPI003452A861